ncbi:MAG: hypothetical protein ACX936_20475 [Marinobacter sp.]
MAAAQMTDVARVLTVCGANNNEIQAFEIRERLNTLEDYAELTSSDITHIAAKIEKRTVADGRVLIPQKLITNMQALCFWARERVRKALPLDPDVFTAQVLKQAKAEMKRREEDQQEAPSIKPEAFKPNNWKIWSKKFDTYLSNHKGAQYAPLDYVIRPEPLEPGHVHTTQRERDLYNYPLTGPLFREDNAQVYRMLSDLVMDTDGGTWIQDYDRAQNGRAAWFALKDHYEGGGQKKRTITAAEAVLDSIHYKNESVFPFESFSRKISDAFRDLKGTESQKSDYEQVKILLERITVPNNVEVEIAKSYVRNNHREDLPGALNYLGTEFARIFPQATFNPRTRYRNVSAYDRNVRPRSQGGQEQPYTDANGSVTYHGVDVTNVGRTFTSEEMTTLGSDGQRYVFSERDRLNLHRSGSRSSYSGSTAGRGGRGGRGGRFGRGGRGGRGGRSIQGVTTDDQTHVSGVTNPTTGGDDTQTDAGTEQGTATGDGAAGTTGNRGPNNGQRFGSSRY